MGLFRKIYIIEAATDEDWEIKHRVFKVKAFTLNTAIRKARKKLNIDESIYQICTKKKGSKLPQPIYDYYNGYMSF